MWTCYWLSGKTKGKVPDIFSVTDSLNAGSSTTETFKLIHYSEPYNFKSYDKRLQLGVLASIGLLYSVSSNNRLSLAIKYYSSLTSIQDINMPLASTKYNNTVLIQVCYLHALHKKISKK